MFRVQDQRHVHHALMQLAGLLAMQQGQELRTPDPDLEYASAEGYRAALSGRPYYGYARTALHLEGGTIEIAFERLIMTLRPSAHSDRRFCAYFGVIQDLQQQ